MKQHLFKYLFVSVILIAAFVKTQAAIIATANTNGLTSPTDISGGQRIAVLGVTLTDPVGSALTSLTFNCNQNILNYFTKTSSSISLVRINGVNATYAAGTGTVVTGTSTSFVVSGPGSNTLTISNFSQTINSTPASFFLVVTFDVGGNAPTPSPTSFNFNLSQVNTTTITPITGPTYTWTNPAIVTVTGNNVPKDNGIEVNDIYYTQQGICVFGFSITVANNKALVTQVALSAALSGTSAPFFSTSDVYVVENNGTDFNSGTNTPVPTTNAVGSNSSTINLNFNTPLDFTPPSATGSITRNFFVYINFNSNFKSYPNAVTFSLNPHAVAYTELSGGSAFTAQTVNPPQSVINGYPIAFATPTIMLTGQNTVGSSGNGISRTTLTLNQTNIVLYGFSLTNTGSQTAISNIQLNMTAISPAAFSNFRVYRSTSSTFTSATAVPANLVGGTIVLTSNVFKLDLTTPSNTPPETLPFNQTTYYFIMADWLTPVSSPTTFQFTYKSLALNSGATIGTSNTDGQQFSLGVPIYDWTGATNSNWTVVTNWLKNGVSTSTAPGITSSKDNVRIGYISYTNNNNPINNNSGPNITIGNLEIGSLGSTSSAASAVLLDLNGKTMTVNNGLSVDSAAVFTLNSSVATPAVGSLKINGGLSTLASTASIQFGSPNPVTFNNAAGTFTLLSDANGTGSIGSIPGNTKLTGTFVVQRYFTGGSIANRGWRLMSSPVNNSSTLPVSTAATYNFSSLKTNLFITGAGGNANGFDQPASYGANGPTILFYTTANGLFTLLTTLIPAPTVNVGSGFYFYFRGDNIHNITQKLIRSSATNTFAIPEKNVVGLQSGTLNQQAFTYTLANAGTGYNLVGNPYPSNITIPAAALTGTTPFVYTFAPGGNSIIAQDLSAGVTIQTGQGFYLKSNSSSSSISFTENLKTKLPGTIAFKAEVPRPAITLKMIQDSANYDIAQLRFSDTYSNNYKETEDADDLNGNGQTVLFGAMTTDGHEVSIASQPLNKQRTSVFLSVNDIASGDYKINKVDISAIPEYYDVWLLDHFQNDSLNIRNNDSYGFKLDKKVPATYGNNRFEIVISKKPLPPYALTAFTGQRNINSNIIKWNTVNEFTYITFEIQYSANDKDFKTISTMQSAGSGSYSFADATAKTGYYRLKQTDLDGIVKYSNVVIISVDSNGADVFTVYPNPTSNYLHFTTNEPVKTTFGVDIYSSMGALLKRAAFNSNTGQLDVSSLQTGFYSILLIDNSTKKTIASAKFIKQ
ncbi:T9SS type A sorting domain-containing protein [Mucilaginibacter sp.]|uniref:T9SS type A sorting domain-containing protein n=1 Tax=Mucilaginibacter sp. TaxID=1882438 RepID=UPI002ED41DD8